MRRVPGKYLVEWDTKYTDPVFELMAVVTYSRPGERGTVGAHSPETLVHLHVNNYLISHSVTLLTCSNRGRISLKKYNYKNVNDSMSTQCLGYC